MSKSDLSLLNAAAGEVTQEALIRNVNNDLAAEAAVEQQAQEASAAAAQKQLNVEDDDGGFDDFEDDPALEALHEKRLADMKARYAAEKGFHAQGHGEYREIVEEEFLKEVCGSEHVLVHFYHDEFIRCKVVDKHLRILAQKHKRCKFLYLNAEKSPFFVTKLAIRMLPTIVVFKDGVSTERLVGKDCFEELGDKDEFRTEVLEHWLSKAGCIKLKRSDLHAIHNGAPSDSEDSDAE